MACGKLDGISERRAELGDGASERVEVADDQGRQVVAFHLDHDFLLDDDGVTRHFDGLDDFFLDDDRLARDHHFLDHFLLDDDRLTRHHHFLDHFLGHDFFYRNFHGLSAAGESQRQ